jgi:hypothetical protein
VVLTAEFHTAHFHLRPKPDWSWAPALISFDLEAELFDVSRLLSHVNDADTYGTMGECFRSGRDPWSVSASVQVRPAPQKSQEANGFTLLGAEGDKVVSMLDPDFGPSNPTLGYVWSNLLDLDIAMVEDPFDNGSWRINTAMGDGAC